VDLIRGVVPFYDRHGEGTIVSNEKLITVSRQLVKWDVDLEWGIV
jgi:hypothetical protein